MTPEEERAEAVLQGWYGRYMNLDQRRAELAAAIREAVASEQERCARVAEDVALECWNDAAEPNAMTAKRVARQVAARIREGGAS